MIDHDRALAIIEGLEAAEVKAVQAAVARQAAGGNPAGNMRDHERAEAFLQAIERLGYTVCMRLRR